MAEAVSRPRAFLLCVLYLGLLGVEAGQQEEEEVVAAQAAEYCVGVGGGGILEAPVGCGWGGGGTPAVQEAASSP